VTQFRFLERAWPDVGAAAMRAESAAVNEWLL
jgi:hypothetical protein